ncbi:hypothetical protein J6590_055996 [Homalodisca vitripennis]|nr:hypothetical protein J6590_055996 [Homalodisca vitripennis]
MAACDVSVLAERKSVSVTLHTAVRTVCDGRVNVGQPYVAYSRTVTMAACDVSVLAERKSVSVTLHTAVRTYVSTVTVTLRHMKIKSRTVVYAMVE